MSKLFRRSLNRKQITIFYIGTVLIFAFLNGRFSPSTSRVTPSPTPLIQNGEINFVFDVPDLVGKDIDQVSAELKNYKYKGIEPTQEQIRLGVKEWDILFKKDGKELLITYDITSRDIVDFFISADDASGVTRDKKHLQELGNLIEGDSRYRIEFVKAINNPTSFTGVKVVPQ